MKKDPPRLTSALPADILKLLDQPAEIQIVRLHRPKKAKLSDPAVRAIRASSDSLSDLASVYGVTRWTISMIRSGRLRKNVR